MGKDNQLMTQTGRGAEEVEVIAGRIDDAGKLLKEFCTDESCGGNILAEELMMVDNEDQTGDGEA